MLKSFLKQVFSPGSADSLVEGAWADQYCEVQQDQIRQQYLARWRSRPVEVTPQSHPWLFDPCEPPAGWRYDPFYELWVKLSD